MTSLKVLVIDDERPALDELTFLLGRDPRVGEVMGSDSATEALRVLQAEEVDAVFLDIQMPGLTGLDLAQVLSRFKSPPPVVFVTAHEEHAVAAFELRAVDYVLKPVRADRLAEAVRRVVDGGERTTTADRSLQIPVERSGVTRFVDRDDVTHVEEVRSEGGRVSVVIGGAELPVSRRHTRELRSVLTRRES
jgi:DNA-binding LytR/AlgR family response regulator